VRAAHRDNPQLRTVGLGDLLALEGREPDLDSGKPAPEFFQLALARLGLASQETAMIGDNPDTDGLGASDSAYCTSSAATGWR